MLRVRMFCDWDDDAAAMYRKMLQRTDGMTANFTYKDMQFVTDDSYDVAIIFNFPVHELVVPPNKAIAILMEPPEIVDVLYSGNKGVQYNNVSAIYSFAKDPNLTTEPAYGIGFTTVLDLPYKELMQKPKKMCMIVSNKLMTPFHHRRHEILRALLDTNLDIDFYGRNMMTGSDPRMKGTIAPMRKWEVLNEYQFCIDFENSPYGAITDKFFDPVLCNTVPISNADILLEVAPKGCFEHLPFEWDTSRMVHRVKEILEQPDISHYVEPLKLAKQAIRSGNMSTVEWVYQKAKELERN